MRVVDADEVHAPGTRRFVGGEQILGPQFVTRRLRPLECVLESDSFTNVLVLAVDGAQHGAAALVRIGLARMGQHGLPRVGIDADHSSSQKCSERYFSALSQRTVTMMPGSPREARSRATTVAAWTLQPDEMPTS